MMYIANPIYDVVFKFMMEDNKVAKLLLSALLKKDIVHLELRPHEYTSYLDEPHISLFRMDFCARIREENGEENLVLLELQKTWLATETLRFRKYLGVQYLNSDNMLKGEDEDFGLPIVSIYLLGHLLGDLTEPVIYVRRRYLDYNDQVILQKDRFIESLTHDSVIVQIPCLEKRTRNRLERLLHVFNQSYQIRGDDHVLKIDESLFIGEEKLIVQRLLEAGSVPEVRRTMDIEDEIMSELEKRDTSIMLSRQQLEESRQQLEQKDQQLEQKEQQLEQKEQQLEEKDQLIEQQKKSLQQLVRLLAQNGVETDEIARKLSLSVTETKTLLSEDK